MDSGHFSTVIKTSAIYPINSAASSITVVTGVAGLRFITYDIYLQVEGDCDLRIKSGSTNLTGQIAFTAANTRERRWVNAGFPVFIGAASGDGLIVENTSLQQVNGWAFVSMVPTW